jgi:hypothetical protein
MGLDVQIGMLGCEGACGFHLLRGRGDREARRDRVLEPPLAAPAFDQRFRLVVAALGCIAQPVGGVAVHYHLAGDHPHAASLGGSKKRIDASRMDGGKGAGGRRPMRQKQIEEDLRHARRVTRVGESGFSREHVPFNQSSNCLPQLAVTWTWGKWICGSMRPGMMRCGR